MIIVMVILAVLAGFCIGWMAALFKADTKVREALIAGAKAASEDYLALHGPVPKKRRASWCCDAVYDPFANALADCTICGWPVGNHYTAPLHQKGPFKGTASIDNPGIHAG